MVLREHIVITDTKILELLQKYDTEHTYTVTQEEFSTALQVHVRHGAHVHRHTGSFLQHCRYMYVTAHVNGALALSASVVCLVLSSV